jgi:uncharacterized protein
VDNIKDFVKRHPQHKSRLEFNVVLAPPLDLEQLDHFFAHEELFTELMTVKLSFLDSPLPGERQSEQNAVKGLNTLYRKYIDCLCKGEVNRDRTNQAFRLLHGLFLRDLVTVHKRFELVPFPWDRKPFPKIYCPLATCIPGVRRTFVGAGGDYWPCERLPQSEYLRIGSVAEGFNIRKIHGMLREWVDFTKDSCADCWCLKDCRMGCFATICDGQKPTRDLKRSGCERYRTEKRQMLIDYCRVLESDPGNFDFMNEIIVEKVRKAGRNAKADDGPPLSE